MADSCYRLVVNLNIDGQFGSSIFHFHFDDGAFTTTQLAASALIDAWDSANRTAFRNCLASAVTMLSIKARKVNAGGGFEAIKQITSSNAGTRTGAIMVAGVCPVAIFLPASTSKLRGKWFIPGVRSTDLLTGIIVPSYMTAINTQLNTLMQTLTLTGGGSPAASPVIYSSKSKTWVAILLAYLSQTVGTLRRRQRPA